MEQGEHEVDPLSEENVPFGQFMQVPPEIEIVPKVQFIQAVLIEFEVNPAEQLKHGLPANDIFPTLHVEQDAEFAGADDPAVQFVQLLPEPVENLPTSQFEQLTAPFNEYFPASQSLHKDNPEIFADFPPTQSTQNARETSEVLPISQFMQFEDPLPEYFPGEQSIQACP